MTTYNNGPGNVPRLPDRVVDTLIASAGVSCCAPGPGITVIDQTAAVERLAHAACEELLARLPAATIQPAAEKVPVLTEHEYGVLGTAANVLACAREQEASNLLRRFMHGAITFEELAAPAQPAAAAEPVGFARETELAKLDDSRVAGVGMMIHKEAHNGMVALYREPVPAAPARAATDEVRDKALVDWLQNEVVDTIYLDDGRIIDVRGGDLRKVIAALRTSTPADDSQKGGGDA
jgi:hypothetical protein